MRLRKRDLTPDPLTGQPTYDMTFGHGVRDYWRDVPDAPAQLVAERLSLWTADWFLDRSEGTPYRTEVLGRGTDSTRDRAVRTRVLATQGVKAITSYGSQVDRDARKMGAQIVISTVYGAQAVTVVPQNADVRQYR